MWPFEAHLDEARPFFWWLSLIHIQRVNVVCSEYVGIQSCGVWRGMRFQHRPYSWFWNTFKTNDHLVAFGEARLLVGLCMVWYLSKLYILARHCVWAFIGVELLGQLVRSQCQRVWNLVGSLGGVPKHLHSYLVLFLNGNFPLLMVMVSWMENPSHIWDTMSLPIVVPLLIVFVVWFLLLVGYWWMLCSLPCPISSILHSMWSSPHWWWQMWRRGVFDHRLDYNER